MVPTDDPNDQADTGATEPIEAEYRGSAAAIGRRQRYARGSARYGDGGSQGCAEAHGVTRKAAKTHAHAGQAPEYGVAIPENTGRFRENRRGDGSLNGVTRPKTFRE